MVMTIGSIFSGIGGIELGFEWEGFETRWFIENDKYCQAVLRKHWPDVPIYGDIRTVDFSGLEPVDVLTGGFPCQDISKANKNGKGIEGERSCLWSYYAEAIRVLRPRYAVIENVPMLANRGLNVVLGDLAEVGYDAEWFTLRASDFAQIHPESEYDGLHRRERLFIITYPHGHSISSKIGGGMGKKSTISTINWEKNHPSWVPDGTVTPIIATNINAMGWAEYRQLRLREGKQQEYFNGAEVKPRFATDDLYERIQRFRNETLQGQHGFAWCKNVRRIEDLQGRPDIPEPLFRGTRDGVPSWMDRDKCLGNAVVPQVAQFIARGVKYMYME